MHDFFFLDGFELSPKSVDIKIFFAPLDKLLLILYFKIFFFFYFLVNMKIHLFHSLKLPFLRETLKKKKSLIKYGNKNFEEFR
jgi:hypothetical protein